MSILFKISIQIMVFKTNTMIQIISFQGSILYPVYCQRSDPDLVYCQRSDSDPVYCHRSDPAPVFTSRSDLDPDTRKSIHPFNLIILG